MDATVVATIGAIVMTLVQITKKALPGDWERSGTYFSAIYSLIGVGVWVVSAPEFPPERFLIWPLFAGWVSIFATASGIYSTATMSTRGTGDGKVDAGNVPMGETAPKPKRPPAPAVTVASNTQPAPAVAAKSAPRRVRPSRAKGAKS